MMLMNVSEGEGVAHMLLQSWWEDKLMKPFRKVRGHLASIKMGKPLTFGHSISRNLYYGENWRMCRDVLKRIFYFKYDLC